MKTEGLVAAVLAAVNALAGVALLLVSGWFIAACAVAGLLPFAGGFNYLIPAAVIRFLAIARIASGYGEKYFGHGALLESLGRFRLAVFDGVMNGAADVSKARQLQRLDSDTDAMAARGISVDYPVIAAFAVALALLGFALLRYLPLLWLWVLAVSGVAGIAFITWRRAVAAHSAFAEAELNYRAHLEHGLSAASLWRGGQNPLFNDAAAKQWQAAHNHLHDAEVRGEWLIRALSVVLLLLAVWFAPASYLGEPLLMIGVFFCLLLPDVAAVVVRAMLPLAKTQQASVSLGDIMSEPVKAEQFDAKKIPLATLTLENFTPIREGLKLPSLDAQLKRGDLLWLQGSSGSGKSSLLLALAGLLPAGGRALLNQTGIDELDGATRRANLLYIEQFPTVLSDTLRQNLALAAPEAKDEELLAALDAAGLNELASDGLDQWLGELGRPLSGGEKKRLGMARALLSAAPVWLLDEPFEGLDHNTVEKLVALLNRERQQRIIIVVSHQALAGFAPTVSISLDETVL